MPSLVVFWQTEKGILLEDVMEPEPMNKVQQVLWLTILIQGAWPVTEYRPPFDQVKLACLFAMLLVDLQVVKDSHTYSLLATGQLQPVWLTHFAWVKLDVNTELQQSKHTIHACVIQLSCCFQKALSLNASECNPY